MPTRSTLPSSNPSRRHSRQMGRTGSMRVLLTGSTGFIGRELAKALSARGDRVVAVSRRQASGSVTWDALEDEVAKADAVVHLAGEPAAEGGVPRGRFAAIRS